MDARQVTQPPFDFSSFITDRTKGFTGREWVLSEIDQWIADPSAPSFLIVTGEPGVGKSAIAARLTQCRDIAAYHFCIARNADTIDPALFARSLSHQLSRIDGYAKGILKDSNVDLTTVQNIQANYGRLIGAKIENLVVNAPSGSTAFTHAVLQPLKSLVKQRHDQQVVLIVDALDEAMQHKGLETIVDLLANSGDLPPQVRFILTSRLDGTVLRQFEQGRIPHLRIDAGRSENLDDIRSYLHRHLDSESIRTRIAEQQTTRETLVDLLTAASQGNFLYVVWILPEIAAGRQRLDTWVNLPHGLDSIYREFLRTRRTRNEDHWRRVYEPILGVLVAAEAPLSRELIAQFARLTVQEARYGLQDLNQFMDPAGADAGQYHLYHQSIADWLKDEARAQEFCVDMESAHRRIIGHYRGVASTWSAVDWRQVDDYGLRNLAMHLYVMSSSTELYGELCDLICQPFMREKRRRTLSHRAFADDVSLMIQAANSRFKPSLDQLVRGCLLYGTLGSAATRIAPSTFGLLTKLGRDDLALDLAALVQVKRLQCQAYLRIGATLQSQQRKDEARVVVEQALSAARGIGAESERADAFREVAVALAHAGGFDEALRLASEITSKPLRSAAILTIIQVLAAAGLAGQALSRASTLDDAERAGAFVSVVRGLVEADDLGQAQRVVGMIPAKSAAGVAQGLVAEGMASRGEFDDAFRLLDQVADEGVRAKTLGGIAQSLAQAEEYERALKTAMTIDDLSIRADALGLIAQAEVAAGNSDAARLAVEALVPERVHAKEVAGWALRAAEAAADGVTKAAAYIRLAWLCSDVGEEPEAVELAEKAISEGRILDVRDRLPIFEECAELLAALGRRQRATETFQLALRAARSIDDATIRTDRLLDLAVAEYRIGLNGRGHTTASEVWDVALTWTDSDLRLSTMADVALILGQFDPGPRAVATLHNVSMALSPTGDPGQIGAQVKLALGWAQVGERARAHEAIDAILEVIHRVADPEAIFSVLVHLVDVRLELGEPLEAARILDRARLLADAVITGTSQAIALLDLAILSRQISQDAGLPDLDHTVPLARSVLESANRLDNGPDAVVVLSELAEGLAGTADDARWARYEDAAATLTQRALDVALDTARGCTNLQDRVVSFARVGLALSRTGHALQARQAIGQAEVAADLLTEQSQKARALERIARTLSTIAGDQAIGVGRTPALLGTAKAFGRVGDLHGAASIAVQALSAMTVEGHINLDEALVALCLSGRSGAALELAAAYQREKGATWDDETAYRLLLQELYSVEAPAGDLSIHISSSFVADAVKMLADATMTDVAVRLASVINDESERSGAFIQIARALDAQGAVRAAADLMKQAADILDEVLASASADTVDEEQDTVLPWFCVAQALVGCGNAEKALEMVKAAGASSKGSVAMASTVRILAAGSDIGQALTIAESIRDPYEKADALRSIAEGLVRLGSIPKAVECLDGAVAIATRTSARRRRLMTLLNIADTLCRIGKVSNARKLARQVMVELQTKGFRSIADKTAVACKLIELYVALGQDKPVAGLVRLVMSSTGSVKESERAKSLRLLAASLAGAHDDTALDQVERMGLAIRSRHARAIALSGVVGALARRGESDRALAKADEALGVVRSIRNELDRASAFNDVVRSLVLIDHPDIAAALTVRLDRMLNDVSVGAATVRVLRTAAWALEEVRCHEDSLNVLRRAFLRSRFINRAEVMAVLADGSRTLAREDGGETLWRIYLDAKEMDGWWVSSA